MELLLPEALLFAPAVEFEDELDEEFVDEAPPGPEVVLVEDEFELELLAPAESLLALPEEFEEAFTEDELEDTPPGPVVELVELDVELEFEDPLALELLLELFDELDEEEVDDEFC